VPGQVTKGSGESGRKRSRIKGWEMKKTVVDRKRKEDVKERDHSRDFATTAR
jgi:hypothetical protein